MVAMPLIGGDRLPLFTVDVKRFTGGGKKAEPMIEPTFFFFAEG